MILGLSSSIRMVTIVVLSRIPDVITYSNTNCKNDNKNSNKTTLWTLWAGRVDSRALLATDVIGMVSGARVRKGLQT